MIKAELAKKRKERQEAAAKLAQDKEIEKQRIFRQRNNFTSEESKALRKHLLGQEAFLNQGIFKAKQGNRMTDL